MHCLACSVRKGAEGQNRTVDTKFFSLTKAVSERLTPAPLHQERPDRVAWRLLRSHASAAPAAAPATRLSTIRSRLRREKFGSSPSSPGRRQYGNALLDYCWSVPKTVGPKEWAEVDTPRPYVLSLAHANAH
jgi:hypothetical protein